MGAAKKLNETAEALIKDFVQELNPEQKERLLVCFPLFLLTAAGGVILGAVIEEIRKEISL